MLPNFLIIGAMKAATSSMWAYLNDHPDIFIPNAKELNFFIEEQNWPKGIDWYQSLFYGRQEKCLGECSPAYTWYPLYKGVPERIKNTIPDVKLIYICRHPIERAFSHYMHFYLKINNIRDINSAFAADSEFVTTSLYYKQLEQFMNFFDRQKLLILSFDDICRDISSVLIKIYDFLDIKHRFITEKITKKFNVTKDKPFYPGYFLKIRQYFPFYKSAVGILPHNFKNAAMSLIARKHPENVTLDKLDKENLEQIVTVVKEDVLKFVKYIDSDISCLKRFLDELKK